MTDSLPRQKIAIISSLYMHHLGGVEMYSQSLAQALSSRYDVHIFCMNTEGLPSETREGKLVIHALPCWRLFGGRLPIPKPSALKRAAALLSAHGFSFAIIQTRLYPFNLWAADYFHRHRTRFILIEHGTGYIQFGNRLVDLLWRGYEAFMTAAFKRRCQSFYAVSQAGSDWLAAIGLASRGVIPNGVFAANLAQPAASWRLTRNIPADALVLTFAGRVIREKGVIDLLQAADQLGNDQLHVVIAGGGDLTLLDAWRDRENVHILGQIPHEELLQLLQDSQLFCLPTAYPEGLPTVVLEAGLFALPVISTSKGGLREVILPGETGIIIPANDVPALQEAIQELVDDPVKRKQYGSALQKLVLDHYIWEKIADQVHQLVIAEE